MRNIIATISASLAVLCVEAMPSAAAEQKPPAGQAPVSYAPIPSRTFLDEKKRLFTLGLAVPIDWPKLPDTEKKRLIPLMTKDVRIRNCIALWQNPNMAAYFTRSGAKMQISVFAAHGEPILATTMTIKNCPAPPKKAAN